MNVGVQEEQPTSEMEVTTDVTQVNQPEKPTQTGDANLMEMLRTLIENNQKRMEETLNKNNESLKENLTEELGEKIDNTNKNMETLKEDLGKKIDNNNKNMETLNTKPVIEPIKENDNIKSCGLSNEHSETVNKNMDTPYKRINNNNDITEVNNKDTEQIINDNKPLIIDVYKRQIIVSFG